MTHLASTECTFNAPFPSAIRLPSAAVPTTHAEKRLLSGAPLFHEGDRAQHVYVVTQGMVKLTKLMMDGRGLILGFFQDGDVIGLASGAVYAYSAAAVTDVVVRAYTRRGLLASPGPRPGIAGLVLERACDELEIAYEHLLLLGLKDPRERVASFLVAMARRRHGAAACEERQEVSVHLPMTRRDIAEHLGLTPETICRVFALFRRRHLIEVPSCADVRIVDWPTLSSYAEGMMADDA
ncbi:MAG: Crp/Fnr family transcriptional regulator [Pseudomonadota bacterium]